MSKQTKAPVAKVGDGMDHIRRQYWVAMRAKAAFDREMVKLNEMINAEKERRGDMTPDEPLPLWPVKQPAPGAE